jgi:hypothetical protein
LQTFDKHKKPAQKAGFACLWHENALFGFVDTRSCSLMAGRFVGLSFGLWQRSRPTEAP